MTTAPEEGQGPGDVVWNWVARWSALDAVGVTELFAPGATYVSGRDGELDQLLRRFRLAARSWQSVELKDVFFDEPLTDGNLSAVAGRYLFLGVDRRGQPSTYSAAVTFVLRRDTGGPWRIARFQESVLPLD